MLAFALTFLSLILSFSLPLTHNISTKQFRLAGASERSHMNGLSKRFSGPRAVSSYIHFMLAGMFFSLLAHAQECWQQEGHGNLQYPQHISRHPLLSLPPLMVGVSVSPCHPWGPVYLLWWHRLVKVNSLKPPFFFLCWFLLWQIINSALWWSGSLPWKWQWHYFECAILLLSALTVNSKWWEPPLKTQNSSWLLWVDIKCSSA